MNSFIKKKQNSDIFFLNWETAVKVTNDLLLAADTSLYSDEIPFDLDSAFDKADHNILVSCLNNHDGISVVALKHFFVLFV